MDDRLVGAFGRGPHRALSAPTLLFAPASRLLAIWLVVNSTHFGMDPQWLELQGAELQGSVVSDLRRHGAADTVGVDTLVGKNTHGG